MKCPLCAADSNKPYAHWPNFEILGCRRCGFRFIDTSSSGYPSDAQYIYDEPEIGEIRPERPHIQRRVRDILRFQRPPGRALDIGCGKGFACTGIDMKEPVIRHLQKHHAHVSWACARPPNFQDIRNGST